MATIERGEFTLKMLNDFRDARTSSTQPIEASAAIVVILKGLGRVQEALVEGVSLFEAARDTLMLKPKSLVPAGLRAAVMAAIATPEVPIDSVKASLDELRRLCASLSLDDVLVHHLALELKATLHPLSNVSKQAASLSAPLARINLPLACRSCSRVRLAWRRRATVPWSELNELDKTDHHCLAGRVAHLKAERFLAEDNLVEAQEALDRASSLTEASVLPVALLTTGLTIARRRRDATAVTRYLEQLSAALVDFEYPYDEFEARLEVLAITQLGLRPRPRPRILTDNLERVTALAGRLERRDPKSVAMKRVARVASERHGRKASRTGEQW
ncbi:MAG: hypothetical protein Q8N26_35125 [Myxococcales bacterium]|nr:hypothetical protein [Myxococcales bacterium]